MKRKTPKAVKVWVPVINGKLQGRHAMETKKLCRYWFRENQGRQAQRVILCTLTPVRAKKRRKAKR